MAATIVILAQDLIWSDRLARAVTAAGAAPARAATPSAFERALDGADLAVVDLTARAYDPMASIERAHASGVRVFAVGQHDDQALRKEAMARGAERVYAYRKLFDDGPATIAGWLESDRSAGPNEAASPEIPA